MSSLQVLGIGKRFELKCRAVMNGISTPTPFNFETIDTYYNSTDAEKIKNALLEAYPAQEYVPVVDLLKNADELIRDYANFLFENDYKLYTAKQWGIPAEEIDVSVLKRVPVCLSYSDRYFSDEYQIHAC